MDNNDLFGTDSDDSGNDTDDLIAKSSPVKKKLGKGRLQKKKDANKKKAKKSKIPDADNDSSGDESIINSKPAKPLSKKERMEALQARKNRESSKSSGGSNLDEKRPAKGEDGYASADGSVDSATFQRTKEDDDFIDDEDEDPDSLRELYAEQHFDDEQDDDFEDKGGSSIDMMKGRASRGSGKKRKRSDQDLSGEKLDADGVPENPMMAAVYRMKRKKKETPKAAELTQKAEEFIAKMRDAASADAQAVKERRPALNKLKMLKETMEVLAKRELMPVLLDEDLLSVCKKWIEPLPNGSLGNVTVRQNIIAATAKMTGDKGIQSHHLKRSGFGKTVMSLYVHKSETPQLKRELKTLIELWSRPIFQKSANLKHKDRPRVGESGIMGIARQQQKAVSSQQVASKKGMPGGRNTEDLSSIISKGYKSKNDLGSNRVRVPYSNGFQFTVQPNHKMGTEETKRGRSIHVKEGRGDLHKRMIEKGRSVSKNHKSANISVDGKARK
mmetsp:Transcript_91/g.240  ORF Transcript_91/g.240 Transcript_91/m.240 type:complete len:500 (+) Transcript_91:151-1650(+)